MKQPELEITELDNYPGLSEQLDRFKNDFDGDKCKLLFSIAYKLGYDKIPYKIKDPLIPPTDEIKIKLGKGIEIEYNSDYSKDKIIRIFELMLDMLKDENK